MNEKASYTVLIVDDEESSVGFLKSLCAKAGYAVEEARNGKEALACVSRHHPDVILMDVAMPEMNGFEATGILKSDSTTMNIPIIMLTGLSSRENIYTGISKGANDFLLKPYDAEELLLRIKNHLKIKDYHELLERYNSALEEKVKEKTAGLREALGQLDETYERLKLAHADTIHKLALTAEFKDQNTGAHIKRLSLYAQVIAGSLKLESDFIDTLYCAIPMHDIGKVGIPDQILFKPGHLSMEEWQVMKTHTTIGARILADSSSSVLRMAEQIALSHHERYDGTGYPQGLKGEAIPYAARITILADQYDALRSKRPYKQALGHTEVFTILTEGDGRTLPQHFDPRILEVFKKDHLRFSEIYKEETSPVTMLTDY
jgi:putative two-component system response regulator